MKSAHLNLPYTFSRVASVDFFMRLRPKSPPGSRCRSACTRPQRRSRRALLGATAALLDTGSRCRSPHTGARRRRGTEQRLTSTDRPRNVTTAAAATRPHKPGRYPLLALILATPAKDIPDVDALPSAACCAPVPSSPVNGCSGSGLPIAPPNTNFSPTSLAKHIHTSIHVQGHADSTCTCRRTLPEA